MIEVSRGSIKLLADLMGTSVAMIEKHYGHLQVDKARMRAMLVKTMAGRDSRRTQFIRLYVMGQRTKWGSCSGRRNLSFNWRLVMIPPAVMDYIVVHELAHLAEPYHSPRFWLIVQSHCPRYEDHRAWFEDNEDRMRLPE